MLYTLLNDGDNFEKHYWNKFLSSDFPTYERYWADKVVPLTNRPDNIHFKKSSDLLAQGYTAEDVCKAQLHYTILRHLVRTYEILEHLKIKQQVLPDTDYLSEGLFHICGAQDVAFEFIQRNKTPNTFDPWIPKKQGRGGTEGSKEAKDKWQKDNTYPLQPIRDFRNHFTHGRILPAVQGNNKVFVPKIGNENNYLDWRLITDGYSQQSIMSDFDTLDKILQDAWAKTLAYLETEWTQL